MTSAFPHLLSIRAIHTLRRSSPYYPRPLQNQHHHHLAPSLFQQQTHTLRTTSIPPSPSSQPPLRLPPSPADLLSLSRLLFTPLVTHFILTTQPIPALLTFTISAATDALDGTLARKYGSSSWGKTIDPICDKIFMGSVVGSMWYMGFMPGWLGMLVVVRDVSILVGGLAGGVKREVVEVLGISKVNTGMGAVAICGGLLVCGYGDEEEGGGKGEEGKEERIVSRKVVDGLWGLWGFTTLVSGGAYLRRFLQLRKSSSGLRQPQALGIKDVKGRK